MHKMRYTGIQPQFFPRLHYFARILNTDVFVMRDDAQFVSKHKYPDGTTNKSFQAHTPIKQPSGVYLLTVPVSHNGNNTIAQTKPSGNLDWRDRHLKSIRIIYGKGRYFKMIYPELENIYNQPYSSLAELNSRTIFWGLLRLTGRKTIKPHQLRRDIVLNAIAKSTFRLKQIFFASEFSSLLKKLTDPNEKILALMQSVGASEDYCGDTALQAYINRELFKDKNINIVVQNWQCRQYPQLFSKRSGFLPNLSIIDLLMNVSTAEAREILHSNE